MLIAAAALAAVILLLAAAVHVISARRLGRVHRAEVVVPRSIPADAASLARGEHIARAIASCTLCHGDDLGGQMLGPPDPVATLAAPNLTRGEGGLGRSFSDADWVRGIRHGVHRDGTSLLVMPSEAFAFMNEPDLAALIAFLRQLAPVDRVMPASGLRPLGRALLAAGQFSVLVAEKTPRMPYPAVVPPGPTVEYGRYLASFSGCNGCHGAGLSGGAVDGPPDTPPASNLTPDPASGIGNWSETDFERAIRHGVRPGGRPIDTFMPWPIYSRLTDEEVRALWLYLRSMPPKPFGNK
jgi:mono/diheme cytochrome c family protein